MAVRIFGEGTSAQTPGMIEALGFRTQSLALWSLGLGLIGSGDLGHLGFWVVRFRVRGLGPTRV